MRSTDLLLPAAVLWDMDGTLVDTEPLWFAAEAALAARHGVPWGPSESEHLIGMPLEVYGGVLVDAGVPLTVEQVIEQMVAEVAVGLRRAAVFRPGVVDLLGALVDAGVPCALVTMSYRELAAPVVAQAPPGSLPVVVTGEDVRQGKPHPEPYLRAAELLGVAIQDCVAIEDSPPGISSAMAAGARTLGVPHLLPVEARPGLSRAASLADVSLATLAAIHAGEVVDLPGRR